MTRVSTLLVLVAASLYACDASTERIVLVTTGLDNQSPQVAASIARFELAIRVTAEATGTTRIAPVASAGATELNLPVPVSTSESISLTFQSTGPEGLGDILTLNRVFNTTENSVLLIEPEASDPAPRDSDGDGLSDLQEILEATEPRNTGLLANVDELSVLSNVSTVLDVLANDSFGDSGPGSTALQITSPPTSGVAVVDNNNTATDPTDDIIVYTPNTGYTGNDALTYSIENAAGQSVQGNVSVLVSKAPPASLQQDALDAGQVLLVGSPASIGLNTTSLAITGGAPSSPSTTLPIGFETNDHYGAVPSGEPAWWAEWALRDARLEANLPPGGNFHPLEAEISGGQITGAATNNCQVLDANYQDGGTVNVFGETFPVCIVTTRITADTTWPNNHIFVLNGLINVGDGDAQVSTSPMSVTLTIQAGTQVYGAANNGSALVITRGSTIQANGTEDLPIIMGAVSLNNGETAIAVDEDVTDLTNYGQWGGLILSGRARVNGADPNNEVASETSPPASPRFFGGQDDNDDSGDVEYVVIAEAGGAVESGISQGLTFEAAGNETRARFVQIASTDDDCVEFMGGTAELTHLLCVAPSDDGIDIDFGFRGTIQYALVRQGATRGDNGIESDSNGDFLATPVSAPILANITVLGNSGRSDAATRGALHREGFAGQLYRSAFVDDFLSSGAFEAGCLDIDDVLPAGLAHFDSVFSCSGGTSEGLTLPDD